MERRQSVILQDAMAVKYKLDVAEQLLKDGRVVLDKGYKRLAFKLNEQDRFSDPIGRASNATILVQETPTDGPLGEFMKHCNMTKLTGQIEALLPFYNEAIDAAALEYETLLRAVHVHAEAIDRESRARSEFYAVLRKLNVFPTIQVASAEEAKFVKEFTSSNVVYSPKLTPEEIVKIRAAIQGIEAAARERD